MAKAQPSESQRYQAVRLGDLIRTRRRGRYSLQALAARAGLSTGLVSDIERGRGNPSYFTLLKIADALEMAPAEFFQFSDPAPREPGFVRRDERQQMVFPDGFKIEILSVQLDLPVVMWQIYYPIGFDNLERPFTTHAESVKLLLEGSIEIALGGHSSMMEAGDALRQESGFRVGVRNLGDRVASAIVASSASPFR